MFDEVTRREGGRRAARRLRYFVGSSALQIAVVAGVVWLSAAITARVRDAPPVPVKIVRPAIPSSPPPPPPPPAPAPALPAAPEPKERPPARAKPASPAAVIQPREAPAELQPPERAAEPVDEGAADGMVDGAEVGGSPGGVAGGVTGGAPEPAGPAGPVRFNDEMKAPVLVSGPALEYTRQALEREIEGVMVVECVVTVEGTVHACRVLKSLPFMDRAVVDNLERRRYRPATLAGKPLDVQYTFTVRLKLP